MENTLKVTRKMMIEALDKRTKDANGKDLEIIEAYRNGRKSLSFGDMGYNRRLSIAIKLYNRLVNGGTPTTNEVVAYFGKGARFVEGE